MEGRMRRIAAILVVAAAGWHGAAALAAEGVIEINDTKIQAAGGYPFVITDSGSYRLTSNLQQPAANVNVIRIDTNNVSIDLNGFAISGTNFCSEGGAIPTRAVTCTQNSVGAGVYTIGTSISVRNGTVTGLGGSCITIAGGQLENLRIGHCGNNAIDLDDGQVSNVKIDYVKNLGISMFGGQIDRAFVSHAGNTGVIMTGFGGTISNVDSRLNNFGGITINRGTVRDSVAWGNQGAGITVTTYSAVLIGNWITDNTLWGVQFAGGGTGLLSQNMMIDNASGWTNAAGSARFRPAGSNQCDAAAC
jgi:hypothetical protein